MSNPALSDPGLVQDIGWVLANAREHAADPVLRTAAGFARAGRKTVHRAQVGRWESGETGASYRLVRRYENVLGLPNGQLLRAIDFLGRERHKVSAVPVLAPALTDSWLEDTDALIERALSTAPMSGVDWDNLSAMLGAHPDTLLRSSDWGDLMMRCSQETAVHVGLEFAQRHEALIRLAGHPRSGKVVVELAATVLADPTTQIFSEAVDLLQHTHHPLGVPLLLAQLDASPAEAALWTVLYTLTTLVESGRVSLEDRMRAGTHALDLLRQDQPVRIHRAAADLLRAVDPPTRHRIVSALHADSRSRIATIVLGGSARLDTEAARLAARIEGRLQDTIGVGARWAPQLRRLISRTTSVTHDDARGNALAVLMLSPQGPAVGDAYAAELRRALAQGQRVLADDALSVLSWLLQPGDIPTLLDLVVDPAGEVVPAMQAAIAIGNCRPGAAAMWRQQPDRRSVVDRDEICSRVFASARLRIPTPGADPRSTARGHCYLLGMASRTDLLGEIILSARQHAEAGCAGAAEWVMAAQWWHDRPEWARPIH